MEKKGKKIKLGLIVSLLIFSLTGCAPAKPKKDKLIVWHWMTDRRNAFDELAKRYKEATGQNVEFKLFFPPEIYAQKVIAAARAKTLPDIFGILGERKTLASFIKAGYILNLSPYMSKGGEEESQQWENSFYPQTLKIVTFSEKNNYSVSAGIYGVPIDTTVMQFIYNKTLFKKAGLNPTKSPQTIDEFINMAQTVKEKLGLSGFICGWGEGWLLNALATEWAINTMGEDKFLKTIEGEVLYTDPDWIKVFSLFAKLKDSGILASNIATMTNKEAEAAFAKDKAAFSFNGSWSVNVYKQLCPELDYAFFSLPKVSGDHPVKVWGGAGSSFMVDAKSLNKDKAINFLRWLSAKKQQKFLAKETNNLPAIKGVEEELPPMLKSLLGTLKDLTHPDIWPRNEDSRVIEIMNRSLQQIVMGLKTPQEAAHQIQRKKGKVSPR
ncbi:MAG: extracellular solute-binding protein [Candidatus Omnitrophica bacterium]|nr:extracellular solute-binding protein [Candidatus Omnitrophota bacterium]